MKRLQKLFALFALALCITAVYPAYPTYAAEATTGEAGTEGAEGEEGDGEATTVVRDSAGTAIDTDTGDAIKDILAGERYMGAISSIEWFTTRVDSVTVMLVSAAAFFIICAAFLKNVCAGVYCANSKFFDKVDDAHKKAEALSIASIKGYFGGGQFQNTSYGTFRDGLLALIPNFKAFTDFEDADIEPKQYFMKSIPQMCFCVIIGIFIYNGYYRDTAMKVGEFGSLAFTRLMTSAQPEALLDKLSATTGKPTFATDGMTDPAGKLANNIVNDAYSAIVSNYSDITTDYQKTTMAAALEQDIIKMVNSLSAEGYLTNTEEQSWEISYEVEMAPTQLTAESLIRQEKSDAGYAFTYMGGSGAIGSVGSTVAEAYWQNNSAISQIAVEKPKYLYVYVNITPTTYKGKDTTAKQISGGISVDGLQPTDMGWASETALLSIVFKEQNGKYVATLPAKTDAGYAIKCAGTNGDIGCDGATIRFALDGNTVRLEANSLSAGNYVAKTKGAFYATDGAKKYLIELQCQVIPGN